jgi:hypothetical protein
MNLSPPVTKERGVQLLVTHLESLDPEAVPARERLEAEIGNELARMLVFALAAQPPGRRAA